MTEGEYVYALLFTAPNGSARFRVTKHTADVPKSKKKRIGLAPSERLSNYLTLPEMTFPSSWSGIRANPKIISAAVCAIGTWDYLLDFLQIPCRSAARISSSWNCGAAMEIKASARSQTESPFMFTLPYSVTI